MPRNNKRKKKLSNFKKFLCIYCGILLLAGVITLIMLHKLLSDNDVKVNEFETNDTIAAYFTDKLNDGTVSYKKKAGEYSEKTPVYVVYAGDTPIAKVELESAGKNAHKFNKWTLGTISFGDFTKGLAEVKITAPTGADVYIQDRVRS